MEKKTLYKVHRLCKPKKVDVILDDIGTVIAEYSEDGEIETPSERSVYCNTLERANAYREAHIKKAKENMQDVANYLEPFFSSIDHVRKNMKELDDFPWPLNKMIYDRYQIDHTQTIRDAFAKMMRVMTTRFIDINGFAVRLDDIKTIKWCSTMCVITLKYKPEEEMNLTVQDQTDSEFLRILFNNDGSFLFSDIYQAEEG